MIVRTIDIETSDLDPATAAVIEIAWVDLVPERDGDPSACWRYSRMRQSLVRLPEGAGISPEASAVHHLLPEDLETAPPLEEVIETLTNEPDVTLYVAHRAEFECFFLDRHLGTSVPWVCTWKCALRAWPGLPSHGNQQLRYRLDLADPFPGVDRAGIQPHRAAGDAFVTAAIFNKLTRHAPIETLLAWSAQPPQYPVLGVLDFGKHDGERYDAVDIGYLEWLADGKHSLREQVRQSARHWLAKRRETV